MIKTKNIPSDPFLYDSIKKKVKAKFEKTSRWPSAYASGYLVKEYKKQFSKKYGDKKPYIVEKTINKSTKMKNKSTKMKNKSTKMKNKSTKMKNKSTKMKGRNSNNNGLTRWFNEKWVNVCKKKSGKYVLCGRKKGSMKKYPYCRPLHRINNGTPMTVGEIKKKYGSKKLKEMCKRKNSKRDKKSMTYVKKSRKWTKKYKKSINCRRPKGFSQKQYCKSKSKSKGLKIKL